MVDLISFLHRDSNPTPHGYQVGFFLINQSKKVYLNWWLITWNVYIHFLHKTFLNCSCYKNMFIYKYRSYIRIFKNFREIVKTICRSGEVVTHTYKRMNYLRKYYYQIYLFFIRINAIMLLIILRKWKFQNFSFCFIIDISYNPFIMKWVHNQSNRTNREQNLMTSFNFFMFNINEQNYWINQYNGMRFLWNYFNL